MIAAAAAAAAAAAVVFIISETAEQVIWVILCTVYYHYLHDSAASLGSCISMYMSCILYIHNDVHVSVSVSVADNKTCSELQRYVHLSMLLLLLFVSCDINVSYTEHFYEW